MATINNAINNACEAGITVTGGTITLGADLATTAINIGSGATASVSPTINIGCETGSGGSADVYIGNCSSNSYISIGNAPESTIVIGSEASHGSSVTISGYYNILGSPAITLQESGGSSLVLNGGTSTLTSSSSSLVLDTVMSTLTSSNGITLAPTTNVNINNLTQGAMVTDTSGNISSVTGTAGYVLTANSGAAPSFQAAGGGGSVTITGDSGSVSGSSLTLTGSTSGAVFTGSGTTLTESFNYLSLPTTTSTNGQVLINSVPYLHGFNGGTFVGGAGNFTTAGFNVTAVGYNAANATASSDGHIVAIGDNAMALNTAGGYGVFVGSLAGYQPTGDFCTAVGSYALQGNGLAAGGYNTAVGCQSMQGIGAGGANACLGYFSGKALVAGSNNVAVGSGALQTATSDSNNTAVGYQALAVLNTSTGGNIAIGEHAAENLATGNYNVIIGSNYTGYYYNGAESNNINISAPNAPSESNVLRLGNGTGSSTQQLNKAIICGINGITVTGTAVLVSSSDQLGVAISSRRFKDNIEDMGEYSSDILKLRPTTFNYNIGDDHSLQGGLIAEEVQEIMPSLVVLDKEGLPQTVKYHDLPALLLNELQKAVKRIEVLEAKLSSECKG